MAKDKPAVDLVIEQVDAAWEGTRLSRQLVRIGIVSAAVNFLVVVVALGVPIYQNWLEFIEQDQLKSDQAHEFIQKSIKIYKYSKSRLGDRFQLIVPICMGSPSDVDDQLSEFADVMTEDARLRYAVTTKFPFVAGIFDEELSLAGVIRDLKRQNFRSSRRALGYNTPTTTDCEGTFDDYRGGAQMLLMNARELNKIYERPIPRPLWILNGPAIVHRPMTVSDRNGTVVSVKNYLDNEINSLNSKVKNKQIIE